MRRILLLVAFVAAGQAGIFTMVAGFHRLANGNTVVVDPGSMTVPSARVVEVTPAGRIVWCYFRSDITWAHTARRLEGGNTLISASGVNRVVEVDAAGNTLWSKSGIAYPNEAFRLANGNTLITVRNENRVIEVDDSGAVAWSYSDLVRPHNGTRLANGNTLVCDSERDRVVEVETDGTVVWQYSPGAGTWPRCAVRLANGNTLIAVSLYNKAVEVTPAGVEVWSVSVTGPSYMVDRLADGHTVVTGYSRVFEFDPAGNRVWTWPPEVRVRTDSFLVRNPASGCYLYVHVHRPESLPGSPLPAVVLVPGMLRPGTAFDSSLAGDLAEMGLVVVHFDPDGRGRSVPGTEDYCGPVHRAGLQAVVDSVATLPYVDTTCIGIYSHDYGVTMATGMIAAGAGTMPAFLLDYEGPADRHQSCADSGGPVPVPPDSEEFWLEREAARFMTRVPVPYLRIQSAIDRNPRITGFRHAIALVDSATSSLHGGSGISPWTRVNDSMMNPANRTYTPADPPAVIPETEEQYQSHLRALVYLQELAGIRQPVGVAGPQRPTYERASFRPSPGRGVVSVNLGTGYSGPGTAVVYDAAGRSLRGEVLTLRDGAAALDVSRLARGAYVVRVRAGGRDAAGKLVIE